MTRRYDMASTPGRQGTSGRAGFKSTAVVAPITQLALAFWVPIVLDSLTFVLPGNSAAKCCHEASQVAEFSPGCIVAISTERASA